MELRKIILDRISPLYLEKAGTIGSELWNEQIAIGKGENVHFIAASGRGKSSLIHFIYFMRKDYAGNIYFDERKATEFTEAQMAMVRQSALSIVFQDLRLFGEQTLYENINIKRILNPYHKEGAIQTMAERLGINHRLDTEAQKCSYGEQQRAAIIRALMQPFDFLLLDEPFSHLDVNNKKIALELIQEESKNRGAAILFAGLDEEDFSHRERIIRL